MFQLFALRRFSEKVADSPDQPIRGVLTRLLVLYGLWSLERSYIAYLAAGQFNATTEGGGREWYQSRR